jgi:muramoyltetrapeptide carboxypeptidase LdcA involved in peptidoglycan recycling
MRRTLRSLAAAGVVERLAGLLVGRAMRYSDAEKDALDAEVMAAVEEAGRADLPVVTNVDFGHTDPQLVIPLGGLLEIDCDARSLRLAAPVLVSD